MKKNYEEILIEAIERNVVFTDKLSEYELYRGKMDYFWIDREEKDEMINTAKEFSKYLKTNHPHVWNEIPGVCPELCAEYLNTKVSEWTQEKLNREAQNLETIFARLMGSIYYERLFNTPFEIMIPLSRIDKEWSEFKDIAIDKTVWEEVVKRIDTDSEIYKVLKLMELLLIPVEDITRLLVQNFEPRNNTLHFTNHGVEVGKSCDCRYGVKQLENEGVKLFKKLIGERTKKEHKKEKLLCCTDKDVYIELHKILKEIDKEYKTNFNIVLKDDKVLVHAIRKYLIEREYTGKVYDYMWDRVIFEASVEYEFKNKAICKYEEDREKYQKHLYEYIKENKGRILSKMSYDEANEINNKVWNEITYCLGFKEKRSDLRKVLLQTNDTTILTLN